MSATLKKQQRNGMFLNVKKEIKKANDLLNNIPLDISALKICLRKIVSYQKRLLDLSEATQGGMDADDEDLAAEIQKSEDDNETLLDLSARLEAAIDSANNPVQQLNDSHRSRLNSSDASHSVNVKLPMLSLPTFDGDSLKFQEFWDAFESTVHSSDLSPVEKFKYLKSALSGDALRLAGGYRLTNANYDAVIDVLRKRYGDPEVTIFFSF